MHSKRFLALSAFLLACAVTGSALAASSESSAYDEALIALQNAGVVDGNLSGDVRLHDVVNRAEALKVILRSQDRFGVDLQRTSSSMPALSLFTDVSQSAWYAPYIEVGFRNGLIKGYPDGSFHPGGGVRVAEAVAMLVRSYGDRPATFRTSDDVPNKEGQWYTDAVSVVIERQAVSAGSRLNVGAFMTRGQLFDMAYRMMLAHRAGQSLPAGNSSSEGSSVRDVGARQFASFKPFAISIPALGIMDLTVTHPSDPYTQKGVTAVLKDGVGHLLSYPGENGAILIYGHSSGWPWDLSQYTKIFRTINKIKIGHRVYVTYGKSLYVYEVTERKTVDADDRSEFQSNGDRDKLILYTCWPPDSITKRFLVIASPVETVRLK